MALAKIGPPDEVGKVLIETLNQERTGTFDSHAAAAGLVTLAKRLQDSKTSTAISILQKVQEALKQHGWGGEAEDVRRAVEYLKLERQTAWLTALQWSREHIWWTCTFVLAIAYGAWFLLLRF